MLAVILKVKFCVTAMDYVEVLHLLRVAFYLVFLNLNFSVEIVPVTERSAVLGCLTVEL